MKALSFFCSCGITDTGSAASVNLPGAKSAFSADESRKEYENKQKSLRLNIRDEDILRGTTLIGANNRTRSEHLGQRRGDRPLMPAAC
jgi:hypothetical protein